MKISNNWKLLLHLLEHYVVGQVITRKQILDKFHLTLAIDESHDTISEQTLDKYRRWLTAAGYLADTHKRGEYRIAKKIDITLSSSECERIAYPHRFRDYPWEDEYRINSSLIVVKDGSN